MEQQKLLWIIFAVATGFLVVVAAAFVLFVPPAETPAAEPTTASVESEGFDVTDYLKNGEDSLALEDEGETGETSFVIGIEDSEADASAAAEQPKQSGAAAGETVIAAEKSAESATTQAPAPATPAPRPQPKKVRVTEYWIQAGSFSQRSSAELARENLKSREFDSVIFTKTVDGTEFFRVRIGPYRYRAEAEKFLEYVKNIDTFEQSQIYEVYVEKTL